MKFADTSWWVAWSVSTDSRHAAALAMRNSLGPNECVLTSDLVVGETWTFLRARTSHTNAVAFLDRIDQLKDSGSLEVTAVGETQSDKAWRWLRQHDERLYSYVDATSFQVMRDRRLRESLSFDGDFAAAGFVEVRPG